MLLVESLKCVGGEMAGRRTGGVRGQNDLHEGTQHVAAFR